MEHKESFKTTIWNKNFICVMASNVFLGFSNSSVNTLVSTFAKFLGAGSVLVGALTGMYFGVAFAMRPIAGPVTTKLDKRMLMIFSFALGMLVNLGYALTRNIGLFVLFRVLTGIQYSIVGSLSMTVASDSLPPEKLGSGLGVYGITAAVSMALGPSIGIALKELGTRLTGESLGFTFVFLFASLSLGLATIPAFLLRLPKRTKEELKSTGVWYKNIVAINALAPALIMMLISMSYSLYSAYMVPYAQALGITGIGSYFTVYAVVLLAARPLSGRLVDRYGTYKMIWIGTAIFAVSFVLAGISRSLIALLCTAVVAALGYGTAQPAVQTMCIQAVPPIKRAVASNTNFFGLDMGLFLGPLLGGVIYSLSGTYSIMYSAMLIPISLSVLVLSLTYKTYEKTRPGYKNRNAGGEAK
jgi:MFS family permease